MFTKKVVTSQDVVGADIVLWFLNPGGNHWILMVCPTHSVEGKQLTINSIVPYCGYTLYVRQLTQRKRRWSIMTPFYQRHVLTSHRQP